MLATLIHCDLRLLATYSRNAGHKLGYGIEDLGPLGRPKAQIRACEGFACYRELPRI